MTIKEMKHETGKMEKKPYEMYILYCLKYNVIKRYTLRGGNDKKRKKENPKKRLHKRKIIIITL